MNRWPRWTIENADTCPQVKDENLWNANELDTILHPNDYFKRSFMLKNLGKIQNGDLGIEGPPKSSGD
jgi:DNA primase large subunit